MRNLQRRIDTVSPKLTSEKAVGRSYVRSQVPRFIWSPELHHCFVHAVEKLGGEEKATPKAIWKAMNVSGISVSHIKSHLQGYRSTKHEEILQVNYHYTQNGWMKKNGFIYQGSRTGCVGGLAFKNPTTLPLPCEKNQETVTSQWLPYKQETVKGTKLKLSSYIYFNELLKRSKASQSKGKKKVWSDVFGCKTGDNRYGDPFSSAERRVDGKMPMSLNCSNGNDDEDENGISLKLTLG